jgi:hypothetical protein
MSRFACVTVTAACLLVSTVASAQLADAGRSDQQVGVFLLRSDETATWAGGVTSKGDVGIDAGRRFNVSWQLDYGSLGAKRVSPSATQPSREAAVSKNSGAYTLSYVRRFGAAWRVTANGGVEHKRTVAPSDDTAVKHSVDPIAAVAVRNVGARLLGADPDKAAEFAWSLQATLASAGAVLPAREARRFFFDPVAVGWLSMRPATRSASPTAEPELYYRVQLRGEAALMRGLGGDAGYKAHWEASLVYFFTPANGIMLRRFDGYFDHNLRDRKGATTVNLVWKFK